MNRGVTLVGYAVLVAAAVATELAARRHGSATFGDAVSRTVRARPMRLLVLTAWLWLGWHLFARVDWQ